MMRLDEATAGRERRKRRGGRSSRRRHRPRMPEGRGTGEGPPGDRGRALALVRVVGLARRPVVITPGWPAELNGMLNVN